MHVVRMSLDKSLAAHYIRVEWRVDVRVCMCVCVCLWPINGWMDGWIDGLKRLARSHSGVAGVITWLGREETPRMPAGWLADTPRNASTGRQAGRHASRQLAPASCAGQ